MYRKKSLQTIEHIFFQFYVKCSLMIPILKYQFVKKVLVKIFFCKIFNYEIYIKRHV